jgi:hypothetical protein
MAPKQHILVNSFCRICYCERCVVLITRPPDITELMKLKAKDLQDYLNRHNIATFGLVGG